MPSKQKHNTPFARFSSQRETRCVQVGILVRIRSMLQNILLLFATYVSLCVLFLVLSNTFPIGHDGMIYIKKDQPLQKIYTNLVSGGYVKDIFAFKIFSHLLSKIMKAGEYKIVARDTPLSLLKKIDDNDVYYRSVTIKEGATFKQVLDTLRNIPYLTGNVSSQKKAIVFPETYNFVRGSTRQSLLDRAGRLFLQKAKPLWEERRPGLPFTTLIEAATLASIVEKETATEVERPIVASVFINRLRKHMPLQSDVTVIYVANDGERTMGCPLTKNDFTKKSPFNTYYKRGLPPYPIATFSLSSLRAVLHPKETPYYYFVADSRGKLIFARTFAQHQKNVRKYETHQ